MSISRISLCSPATQSGTLVHVVVGGAAGSLRLAVDEGVYGKHAARLA